MEETLFQKATILWDKGELVSSNADERTSLYSYANHFFIISYSKANEVVKIERISGEKAAEVFDPKEWRIV